MFRKSQKNYVELNMRISYDEKTDSVNITSKDKNIPAHSGGFRLTLNGGREAEQTLREILQDAGVITDEHIIPTALPYETIAPSPWDEFPLGIARGSRTATWNPTGSPHLLLTGPASAGKSVIQRNLIFHCLQHPSRWRVLAIDPMKLELLPYAKYSPTVVSIATELKDALEICQYAHSEMMNRYKEMEKLEVYNYRDLPNAPHAVMFLVNDASTILSLSGNKTEQGRAEDKIKGEISMILHKIARLGRPAGIHLVLSTQRPDATILSREMRRNLTTKIVMGRVDSIHSRIVLDNEDATRIQGKIKGRGYIQNYESGYEFQAAFAPLDWYDELISKNPHLNWPGAQTDKGE